MAREAAGEIITARAGTSSFEHAGLTALSSAWARLVDRAPDRAALTCAERTVTRGEFDRRTNALAREYADRGVRAGSTVTIALPNGIEFFEAVFAVWKLGATPMPMPDRLTERERAAITALADPALMVGVPPERSGQRPAVAAGFEPRAADSPLPPVVAPEWKAVLSGGSTGRPKLIVAPRPAVLEQLRLNAAFLEMTDERAHLITLPLWHNSGFLAGSCALFTGNHVVIEPRFDPAETLRLIEQYQIDWVFLVPSMMHRIDRLPEHRRMEYDLSSLRVVMHGGAPCAPWLKYRWISWLGPQRIYEVYGTTEGVAGCLINGREWLSHQGSVGRPKLGDVGVFDETGRPLGPHQLGEIWTRTSRALGPPYRYIGATPRLSADGRWHATGDMGWLDAYGYLYIVDRRCDLILVAGAPVYPAEVEAALEEHPGVLSSCVVGLPDDQHDDRVHAIIQTEGTVHDDDLRSYLATRLARYKLPRTFERVQRPLRDAAGKVRRSQLRAARLP